MFVIWKKGEVDIIPSSIYILNIDDGICWSSHFGRCPKKSGWIYASSKIPEAIKSCIKNNLVIFLTRFESVYSIGVEIINQIDSKSIPFILSDNNKESIKERIKDNLDEEIFNGKKLNCDVIFIENGLSSNPDILSSDIFLDRFSNQSSSGAVQRIVNLASKYKTLIIIVSHSIEISNKRSNQLFNMFREKKVYILSHRNIINMKGMIKTIDTLDLFETYDVVIADSTNVRKTDREAIISLFPDVNIIICWDTHPGWGLEKTKYKEVSLISKALEIDDISNHTISNDRREIKLMRCS